MATTPEEVDWFRHVAGFAANVGFEVKRVEITGMDRVDQLKVYDIVLAEKDRAMPLVDIEALRADIDEALLAGPAQWAQLWQRDQGVLALAAAAREKRLAKAWAAAGLS